MESTKINQKEGIPVLYQQIRSVKKRNTENSWYYFGLAGQIGFAVALPIAGGAILGSYIDRKLGSYPTYTISLLFAGIVLSMINFIITIQTILKKGT